MSKATIKASRGQIENKRQKVVSEEMLRMMHNGFKMGKILYKKRDEMWTRDFKDR